MLIYRFKEGEERKLTVDLSFTARSQSTSRNGVSKGWIVADACPIRKAPATGWWLEGWQDTLLLMRPLVAAQ